MLELIAIAALGASSPELPRASADIGLVLSVEDYAHRPRARYAQADAQRFEGLLRHTIGVPPQRILRIDGDQLAEARLPQIVEQVAGLAEERPGGRLWVHVGGHGAMVVRGGRPVTVLIGPRAPPAPAEAKAILPHALDLSALLDQLDRLPIRGGLALLEVCRTAEDPSLRPQAWLNPGPRRRLAVWWAAQIGGPAVDLRGVEGGGLTHFALRAFREAADDRGRLSVDAARAFAWHRLRGYFAARGAWHRPAPRLVAAREGPPTLFDPVE